MRNFVPRYPPPPARLPGPSAPLCAYEAERALALWRTGLFDTLDIAGILMVKQDAVWRFLQAARDMALEMRSVAR
jgi:hypothetical protein